MHQAKRAAIANKSWQVGGGLLVAVGKCDRQGIDQAARTLAPAGRFLELLVGCGPIQKALCTHLIRRVQAIFLVAWPFLSIAYVQQFTSCEHPRSRVGPVRSCSTGSCHAFQSPYLPTTWACNSLEQSYPYPLLQLRIPLCNRVQKS
jgi:hypothetical protein